jgi:hypothetical protein
MPILFWISGDVASIYSPDNATHTPTHTHPRLDTYIESLIKLGMLKSS